jgi:hypothetical protein
MTAPLLYTAELDLPDADIEPFKQWYASRHAPDVYHSGFLTCTCYRMRGGDMNLFDLYELQDWAIFEHPRYLAACVAETPTWKHCPLQFSQGPSRDPRPRNP